MKCPLMSDKDYSVQLEQHLNIGDCLKEECAWWIPQGNVCAIPSLACAFRTVYPTLQEIENKMPQLEQP